MRFSISVYAGLTGALLLGSLPAVQQVMNNFVGGIICAFMASVGVMAIGIGWAIDKAEGE